MSARARWVAYSAKYSGCGSQGLALSAPEVKPNGEAWPDQGSGTRQPSRMQARLPVRRKIGSVSTSSGRSTTSGRPSSSPW